MKYKHKKGFLNWMFQHIRAMQDNMILLENNLDELPFKLHQCDLIRRCIYHDLDKFNKNKIDSYYYFYFYKHIKKTEISSKVLGSVSATMTKHYSTNRHHADFHIITGKPFTNLDLCEMCCDMIARTEANYGDCKHQKAYCEEKYFVKYPEMLQYKNKMYELFNLLIKLKQNNYKTKQEFKKSNINIKYKYKQECLQYTFTHIRMVQNNMILLENNLNKLPFKLNQYDLIRRCIYHDLDKFKKNKIDSYYYAYVSYIEGTKNIPRTYLNNIDIIKNKHYSTNRHHADFHIITGKPFTNLDLCEMCCDMIARTEANYGDCEKYKIYCEEKYFVKYPEMLKYKEKMYRLFDLLIKLKKDE